MWSRNYSKRNGKVWWLYPLSVLSENIFFSMLMMHTLQIEISMQERKFYLLLRTQGKIKECKQLWFW